MAKKILHLLITTAITGLIVGLVTYGMKTYYKSQSESKMREIILTTHDK